LNKLILRIALHSEQQGHCHENRKETPKEKSWQRSNFGNTLEMVSQEKLFEVGPVGSLIQQSVHYVPKSLTQPLVQAKNGDQPIWK
jgi:hypothetical protein